jgi:hypothetical protein
MFPDAEHGRYFNVDFYRSQPRFLYGALKAARSPLWEPYLEKDKQIPLNKPFLMDKSADFRKRWTKKPRVVGVMVANNEAESLPSRLVSLGRDLIDDVILVDDGSQDATSSVARHLGLKVLRHDTPQGYGACLKSGIKKALDRGADYVLVMGGASELATVEMLEASLSHMLRGADVILGSRLRDPYHALVKGMPFLHYVFHLWCGPLVSWVLGREMTDLRPPVRLFSALFLRHVPLDRRPGEDDIFPLRLLLQAAHLRAQWAEFPIYWAKARIKSPWDEDQSRAIPATNGPSIIQGVREILAFVMAQTGLRASRAYPIKKGRVPEFWTDQPLAEDQRPASPKPSAGDGEREARQSETGSSYGKVS